MGWIKEGWSSDTEDSVSETVRSSNTTCSESVLSEAEYNGESGLNKG